MPHSSLLYPNLCNTSLDQCSFSICLLVTTGPSNSKTITHNPHTFDQMTLCLLLPLSRSSSNSSKAFLPRKLSKITLIRYTLPWISRAWYLAISHPVFLPVICELDMIFSSPSPDVISWGLRICLTLAQSFCSTHCRTYSMSLVHWEMYRFWINNILLIELKCPTIGPIAIKLKQMSASLKRYHSKIINSLS